MSWLQAFEHSNDLWGGIPLEIEQNPLDLQPGGNQLDYLAPVSGTLDEMPIYPIDLPENKHSKAWTRDEDTLLISLVEVSGQNWGTIAKHFPHKKPSMVQKRWENKHNPSIKRSKWTSEEDQIVLNLYREQGACWKLMGKQLDGRSPESIKNRFYGTIKKKLSKTQKLELTCSRISYKNRSRMSGCNQYMAGIDLDGICDSDIQSFGIQESVEDKDPEKRIKAIEDLYERMSAIEAFISKTKHDIKNIKVKKRKK